METTRLALVLDMDGVIIDSSYAKSEIFIAVFAARWPNWEERVRLYNEASFGVPRAHKMRELLQKIVPDTADAALLEQLLGDYADRLEHEVTTFPLIPGVADVVGSGRYDIFVCSAAPIAEIRVVLAHHGLLDKVKGIFDGTTPKRDALIEISAVYGKDCLFVGDAAADKRAAMEAGVTFVLRRSDPEANDLTADRIIPDLEGFDAIVSGLGKLSRAKA